MTDKPDRAEIAYVSEKDFGVTPGTPAMRTLRRVNAAEIRDIGEKRYGTIETIDRLADAIAKAGPPNLGECTYTIERTDTKTGQTWRWQGVPERVLIELGIPPIAEGVDIEPKGQ